MMELWRHGGHHALGRSLLWRASPAVGLPSLAARNISVDVRLGWAMPSPMMKTRTWLFFGGQGLSTAQKDGHDRKGQAERKEVLRNTIAGSSMFCGWAARRAGTFHGNAPCFPKDRDWHGDAARSLR
jgi:hypothetical protein